MFNKISLVVAVLALSVLSGCGGTNVEVRLAGEAPVTSKMAPITIGADTITKVMVTISDVSVHTSSSAEGSAAGWTSIPVTGLTDVDLLTLQGAVDLIMGSVSLTAGTYQQIRLTVSSASILIGTSTTPVTVTIPSGVLRVNFAPPLTIAADTKYRVVLNFNSRQLSKNQQGAWSMTPVLSVTTSVVP